MATYEQYLSSAKEVQDLGVFCVQYGITKTDLHELARKKHDQEQKEYDERHSFDRTVKWLQELEKKGLHE